eukprot:1175774-Prorocentrum_minimum.AAC.1
MCVEPRLIFNRTELLVALDFWSIPLMGHSCLRDSSHAEQHYYTMLAQPNRRRARRYSLSPCAIGARYGYIILLHFTGPAVPITARMHSTPQGPFRCPLWVMRGSIAAVEQHPGPLTPPGEVAGVSFAPQAELVFEEDEYTRNRRRE